MPFELWMTYAVLCVMFALTPGPAVLLTAGQAIARGFGAGFAVVLGTQLGNLVYFIISAAGLGAILMASELAFSIVKYAGAAYLIYLGIHTILNARKAAEPAEADNMPLWSHPFMQGLLNQLANPKSILFWGALFPQFVDYHGSDLLIQFAVLAVTAVIADIVILSAYGAVAARGGRFLARGARAVWRERLSGGALVAVGGALSLVKRTG